jgi:Arc-like DNA binding domain
MERNSTTDRALVHTHVPRAVREELRQVAQTNHRSLAGEVRRAIAEHLERERPPETGRG